MADSTNLFKLTNELANEMRTKPFTKIWYMLHIHDAVAVICRVYPEHLPDQGRDLKKDRICHGLHPYLHDTLSFAMVELPEREQAHPSFDTLYTLAKKLEAG